MTDEYFCALEVSRTQAIVRRDMETIERVHAPGYELVTPAGRVFTRERYVAAIASEPFYTAWEHRQMRVRQSVSMAVVRYQAILTFPSGKVVECWHTDSYELVGNSLQAVWSQATQLPQASAKQ
jgi:Domain of unknown function (DUF4440)